MFGVVGTRVADWGLLGRVKGLFCRRVGAEWGREGREEERRVG